MRGSMRLATLLAASVFGTVSTAGAQVFGIPVRNAGVSTGITFGVDFGLPNADAGDGWAIGGSAALGLGPLGVSASAARLDPEAGDAFTSLGATAGLKVCCGPLLPLSVTAQAGAAYGEQDDPLASGKTKLWHFPVGVGFTVTIPNPVLAIKPWAAPRLDVLRTNVPGTGASTDTNFGVSGGIDLSFLNGLGIRAMYDRVFDDNGDPAVVSFGLSWGLRVGP